MTTEAFGPNIFAGNGILGVQNRKQSGFEIDREKRTLLGGEPDRGTKMYSSSDLNYYKSAGEIASEVIKDQTRVPNKFLLRTVVPFIALIGI